MSNCVELNEGFKQVCMFLGIDCDFEDIEKEFCEFMLESFDIRTQYLELSVSKPTVQRGKELENTGGRLDVVFAIHTDDIEKLAAIKMATNNQIPLKWIEDVMNPNNSYAETLSEHLNGYCSWDASTTPAGHPNTSLGGTVCNHTPQQGH